MCFKVVSWVTKPVHEFSSGFMKYRHIALLMHFLALLCIYKWIHEKVYKIRSGFMSNQVDSLVIKCLFEWVTKLPNGFVRFQVVFMLVGLWVAHMVPWVFMWVHKLPSGFMGGFNYVRKFFKWLHVVLSGFVRFLSGFERFLSGLMSS